MDTQITKLARQLRDEGIAPDRDLLPGIWTAIDDSQQQATSSSNTSSTNTTKTNWTTPKNKSKAPAAWRMVAVAATLTLLLGSGYFQSISHNTFNNKNLASTQDLSTSQTPGSPTEQSLLRSLNNTISDLAKAQAQDPNNLNLTRLSLLTHKSRANLLRAGISR